MTPYQKLIDHIKNNGGAINDELLTDGKWHNIPEIDAKKGNMSFGYIAFQNQDGSIGGKIKNYYLNDEGESFIFTDNQSYKNNTRNKIVEQQFQRERSEINQNKYEHERAHKV